MRSLHFIKKGNVVPTIYVERLWSVVSEQWRSNAGGQHHHRINFDKYHPGYLCKVGMRSFHLLKKGNVAPTIQVERLWSLVSEQSRKHWADKKDKAPVIDVMKAGYMKVIGKGKPPEHPVIVNARRFTN